MSNPKIFISYCHRDEEWKDRLEAQVGVLPVQLAAWSDREIQTGEPWEDRIREAMDHADLAVLLVTPSFLSSEFIRSVEVPRLLERHSRGELQLYPVIISHCAWQHINWLQKLQVRPRDGKPLVTFGDQSDHCVEEQLALIAHEIAGVLLGTHEEEPEPEDASRLLAELAKSLGVNRDSRVAEAPDDLDTAIRAGLSDVSDLLSDLVATSASLGLMDIERVVSKAIQHGAGIYNHSESGRVGCARIYHRAAQGLVELAPKQPAGSDGQPAQDAQLAIDWLRRIVMASPLVERHVADPLAWELRFAFDSLHTIPLCDQVSEALCSLSVTGPDRKPAAGVIAQVLQRTESLNPSHARCYVLRHTAELLHARLANGTGLSPDLTAVQHSLNELLSSDVSIRRESLEALSHALPTALAQAGGALMADPTSESSRSWKRWTDPREWFSQN